MNQFILSELPTSSTAPEEPQGGLWQFSPGKNGAPQIPIPIEIGSQGESKPGNGHSTNPPLLSLFPSEEKDSYPYQN